MVLEFSQTKSFLIRVVIYFVVLAFSFWFIGYFMAEQLPVIFENLLHSSANGSLDFGSDWVSWELVRDWTTNGLTDFFSGIFSIIFAGIGDPSIRIGFSRLSMEFVSRPVLLTV